MLIASVNAQKVMHGNGVVSAADPALNKTDSTQLFQGSSVGMIISQAAVTCQMLSDCQHMLPAAESVAPAQLAEAGERTP